MITGKHKRRVEELEASRERLRRSLRAAAAREAVQHEALLAAQGQVLQLEQLVSRQEKAMQRQRERLDTRKAKVARLEAYIVELQQRLSERVA